MKNKFFKIGTLAAILIGVGSMTACAPTFTDPSLIALRYSGGVGEGGKFKECVEPGTKQYSDDTYYAYPTTQREDVWDSDNYQNGSNSADHADLQVSDKDGNIAYLKVKVIFTLNTDCDVLREFHEKIGRTRQAYFNPDGTYGDGWLWAMDNYISSAAIEKAKEAAVNYTVDDMWLKPAVRDEIASAIAENIQAAVDAGTEGDSQFYRIGDVRVFGAVPDTAFTDLYKERKAAQVKADTAEANKQALIAEAKAKAEVARQEAAVRRAEIAGYGSVDAYLRAMMIDKGMNPYQPSYGGVVASAN